MESQEITIETGLARAQRRVEVNHSVEIPIEASRTEATTNPDKGANEIICDLKDDGSNPPDGHLPSQQPALMHSR